MKSDDTNETNIAAMATNIEWVKSDIKEIKESIKDLSGVYLLKREYLDNKVVSDERMAKLEQSSNLWKWLSPTLSAILAAVLTILIISYLDKLK